MLIPFSALFQTSPKFGRALPIFNATFTTTNKQRLRQATVPDGEIVKCWRWPSTSVVWIACCEREMSDFWTYAT
jgi:hypothetical protein